MQGRELAKHGVFQQGLDFLDEYAHEIPAERVKPGRELLERAMAQMEATERGQKAWHESNRNKAGVRAARRALHDKFLVPLSALAESLPDLSDAERRAFKAPRSRAELRSTLRAGGRMAQAARKHEVALFAAGLPPSFLVELDEAVRQLHAGLVARSLPKVQKGSFRMSMEGAIEQGEGALRVLGEVLKKVLTPELYDHWETVTTRSQ